MELSKLPFTLKPQNTVSDLSIAPYFPFARVIPVDQALTELATHMEAVITLAPVEGAQPFCSVCGENGGRLHMYGTRRVRDLNLAHARVELVVPNRKLRCATCRTIRTEGHSFLDPYRRHTLRFERAVAGLCRHMTIKQVADHFGLSWHAVKEIDNVSFRTFEIYLIGTVIYLFFSLIIMFVAAPAIGAGRGVVPR